MSTVIPTGFCEAQLGITSDLNSHVSSISLGFQCTTADADVINLLGVLNEALPNLSQDMSDHYAFTDVRLTFPDGFGGEGSVTLPLDGEATGGLGGDLHDPRSAFVVTKITNVIGRKGRGRFYLPGVLDDEVEETGKFGPTFTLTMNNHLFTFLDTLLNPPDPLEAQQPYLLHSDPDVDPSPIGTFTLSPLVARIRRRVG